MKNSSQAEEEADTDTRDACDPFLESQDVPNTAAPSLFFSKRFLVMVLSFFSYMNIAFLEFNVNIAIIEMTSPKLVNGANDTKITQLPEFQWDSKTIALVLSTFSYGKLLSFLSGSLISVFGGSTSWSLSMLAGGIATALQSIALGYSFYLFLACRFLAGTFQSFCMTMVSEIYSSWIPKGERGMATSLSMNGFYIGIAIVNPICGYIATDWGWSMVFYFVGVASSIMSLICLLLVRNHPSDDQTISKKELAYILRETNTNKCSKKIATSPYKKIFTSVPIWALCIARFVAGCAVATMLTSLPLFIKDATKKSTKDVAFISSLPNFIVILVTLSVGTLMDYWRNNSKINPNLMHKASIGAIFGIQMILFAVLPFVGIGNLITIVVIFTLIRASQPFVIIILQLVSLSIAPNHTGMVAGFTLSWFASGMIVMQMITGFITINHTLDEWNQCFFLTAAISLLGLIIFTLYGSSDAQPWSTASNVEDVPSKSSSKSRQND